LLSQKNLKLRSGIIGSSPFQGEARRGLCVVDRDPDSKVINRKDMSLRRRILRNSMPNPELKLWLRIRNRQISGYKFRRQHSFGHFVVDFYCPEARLVIEVDGDFHFNQKAKERDIVRQKFIESNELSFLRFTNIEVVENVDGVVSRIEEFLNPH